MLRSIRYGEADRVLHLYTPDRGRLGAVAKGVRRVKSRLGGRLEPLSRVRLVLHQGRGDLCTISQADTVQVHRMLRDRRGSLERATQACEAVLRLLDSTEPNRPAYNLLCNELTLLDASAEAACSLAGPGVSPEAAAGRGLRAGAGLVRLLRRGRAARRVLAARRRDRLRGLRGGLVPARSRSPPFSGARAGTAALRSTRRARGGALPGRPRDRRDARVPRARSIEARRLGA